MPSASSGLSLDTSYKAKDTLDDDGKHINTNDGMKNASKYIANQMLEEQHLKVLHRTLSTAWNKSSGRVHSLSAAISLMEQYGVKLEDSEVESITAMDEERQIASLVMKMPQDSNEQFQQFFLQLQLLVSTAMRVRHGLEEGAPDKVAAALDDADSTGVAAQVLRMAVVQAGTEVGLQMNDYEAYVKDVDSKMAGLIRGQEDAMSVQKKLAHLQARLNHDNAEHRMKSAKVMMNFIGGMTHALKKACFAGWSGHARRATVEREIAAEYEERLEDAQKKFFEYREAQLGNVRSLFDKRGMAYLTELKAEVFKLWLGIVEDRKENEALAGDVEALHAKLAAATNAQKENTKKVMERMGVANELQLLQLTFQSWSQECEMAKKDGVLNSMVRESENKIKEYLKGKSDSAKKVLEAAGMSDSALLQQFFHAWRGAWEEAKQEAELEAALNDQNSKLAAFGERNKAAGTGAMERAKYYTEQMLLMQVFHSWKMDTQMEITLKKYQWKIEAKRQQLLGVHQMFRSFAHQLEAGLKGTPDTDAGWAAHKKREKGLDRHDHGSVSLPDIHKPTTPTSGKKGKHHAEPPRTAWG